MGVVMIKCPETGRAIPTDMNDGSGKVSMQSGIFRTHLLFDLQSQPRMVCQGCLGSRARREKRAGGLLALRSRDVVARDVPLRRGDPFSGSLAGGPSRRGFASADGRRPAWQTAELAGGDRPPIGRYRADASLPAS